MRWLIIIACLLLIAAADILLLRYFLKPGRGCGGCTNCTGCGPQHPDDQVSCETPKDS